MATTPDTATSGQPAQLDFAVTYARFASSLRLEDIPRDAIEAARTNLFDTLACAFAGRSAKGVCEMESLVRDWGGAGEASVWGSDLRVPAPHAALVNATMAHARDYDDTHDTAVLHAGVSVIPAALAAAQCNRAATGADLLAGIVAGLELICRLGTATSIGIIESGYMYTSLFGNFAAVVAAGRVLGLDAEQTENAIGIVYSQAGGTHQVTRDAALTKRIQPGFAARSAMVAVEMARRGITGTRNTFEGEDGLFRSYLRGRYDPQRLRRDLGRTFECTRLSYKPYPCCRFNHTAIDAALNIRAQLERAGMGSADILGVAAGTNRQAFEAVCTPPDIRRAPRTIVQAQFSLPYTVARALVCGNVGLSHFFDEALQDPEVIALASRIDTRIEPDIEKSWSRGVSPTLLMVDTSRGTFIARHDHPKGGMHAPMSEAEFDRKLRDCIDVGGRPWNPHTPELLRATLASLENQPKAGDLVSLLRPSN